MSVYCFNLLLFVKTLSNKEDITTLTDQQSLLAGAVLPQPGGRLLGQVGPLLGLPQPSLRLPELGQVERRDLLGFLYLLLVRPHLLLQLVRKSLQLLSF